MVFHAMADGDAPPAGFNSATMVFVPKGAEEGDAVEVSRKAMSTRPLSLNSSDSKLAAAVANRKVASVAASNVQHAQRAVRRHYGPACLVACWTT